MIVLHQNSSVTCTIQTHTESRNITESCHQGTAKSSEAQETETSPEAAHGAQSCRGPWRSERRRWMSRSLCSALDGKISGAEMDLKVRSVRQLDIFWWLVDEFVCHSVDLVSSLTVTCWGVDLKYHEISWNIAMVFKDPLTFLGWKQSLIRRILAKATQLAMHMASPSCKGTTSASNSCNCLWPLTSVEICLLTCLFCVEFSVKPTSDYFGKITRLLPA